MIIHTILTLLIFTMRAGASTPGITSLFTSQETTPQTFVDTTAFDDEHPLQGSQLALPETAPAKSSKGSDLSKESDFTFSTEQGFAAPEENTEDTPDSDEEAVDESMTPNLDEDITSLSNRIEEYTRPHDLGKVFSLNDVFAAVASSPRVLMLEQDALSSSGDTRLALSKLFPDLNATYRYGRDQTRPGNKNAPKVEKSSHRYGITASYTLFNGLADYHGKKAADFRLLATRYTQIAEISKYLLDAVKAYAGAVATKSLLLANERKVALANETLKVALSRHKVGDITLSELKTARAGLARARSELEKARADSVRSLTGLENIVDKELDDLHLPPLELPGEFPTDFEGCKALALAHNPVIKSADQSIKALKMEVNAAYGALCPSISLQYSAMRSKGRNWEKDTLPPKYPEDSNLDMEMAVSVDVPLDYKSARKTRAQQKVYSLHKELARLRYTRLSIILEIKKIWSEYTGAVKSIKHIESQVKAASQAWKAHREGFQQGSEIGVALLQAERDYISAEIDLIRTNQERLVLGYTLLHFIGNLNKNILASACPFEENVHDCDENKAG